jgi:hypothetical protein
MVSNCKIEATSPTERLVVAQKFKSAGMGLMVSGMGCLIGVGAGLSSSLGPGSAIGIGIGASAGLFVAGVTLIKKGNAMIAAEGSQPEETV